MASYKRPAAGFSLVEVLVSIVVLSLGLLGAVGMLTTSVRSTNESGAFTTAVNLARELSEMARINKSVAARNPSIHDGHPNPYLIDFKSSDSSSAPAPGCVSGTKCNPSQLAAWDVHNWKTRVQEELPEGHVVVCFDDALMEEEGDDDFTWECTDDGRNLVVKLGWIPRMGSSDEMGTTRPPRVVMQLVPGHDYDGSEAI